MAIGKERESFYMEIGSMKLMAEVPSLARNIVVYDNEQTEKGKEGKRERSKVWFAWLAL